MVSGALSSNPNVAVLLRQLAETSEVSSARAGNPLDHRTRALVRIGAAVCGAAPTATFQKLVGEARDAGATEDEVLGSFLCVASVAGEPRVVSASPRISLALGYDIQRAFERE
jgi:alkylhydroperoxidase/carboxymuconolactone decarboxylase family protein YurZ